MTGKLPANYRQVAPRVCARNVIFVLLSRVRAVSITCYMSTEQEYSEKSIMDSIMVTLCEEYHGEYCDNTYGYML